MFRLRYMNFSGEQDLHIVHVRELLLLPKAVNMHVRMF